LTNLPADQALAPALQVLATATPACWDRTCQEIADRLGVDSDTDTDTARRQLHRAVRAWHDDPRAAATRQLDNARQVRARLEAVTTQTPEQRWSTAAARIDPRLPQQQDWPALAATMQHLHEQGHDVQTLAQASAAEEPLARNRPAQDLRYRLAVIAPPQPTTSRPATTGIPRRPETERRATNLTPVRPTQPHR
jgi:hypothetical protein